MTTPHSTDLASTHTSSAPFRASGEQVLLVDDEPTILELMTAVFRSLNFQVLPADGGAAAIAAFQAHHATLSLVVTDLSMPQVDGPAVIDAVHEIDPDFPVIVMSGALEDAKRLGPQRTATVFLHKPFTRAELTLVLQRIFGHRNS